MSLSLFGLFQGEILEILDGRLTMRSNWPAADAGELDATDDPGQDVVFLKSTAALWQALGRFSLDLLTPTHVTRFTPFWSSHSLL
jgi:hypothetical protein